MQSLLQPQQLLLPPLFLAWSASRAYHQQKTARQGSSPYATPSDHSNQQVVEGFFGNQLLALIYDSAMIKD